MVTMKYIVPLSFNELQADNAIYEQGVYLIGATDAILTQAGKKNTNKNLNVYHRLKFFRARLEKEIE